jgi:hypothetical protein
VLHHAGSCRAEAADALKVVFLVDLVAQSLNIACSQPASAVQWTMAPHCDNQITIIITGKTKLNSMEQGPS